MAAGLGTRLPRAVLAFVPILTVLIAGGSGTAVVAQVHQIDDAPWPLFDAGGPRGGVALSWQRARDDATRWRLDRLGFLVLMPAGERSLMYLRVSYLRLDTADLPALARWPQIRHESLAPPQPGRPDWPAEAIVNGVGRPEFGFMTPLKLPLAGPGALSLLAGLPLGSDRVYPVAASCLPLVADWRRTVTIAPALHLDARLGWEQTFSFLADEIDGDAFPSGWRHGARLGSPADHKRGLWLGYAARELTAGRHQRDVMLGGWLPIGGRHRMLLHASRSLDDRDHRWAAWSLTVTWHLAGLLADTTEPAGARGQIATPGGRPPAP